MAQQAMPGRIRVAVHAQDPVIHDGLASCLRLDRRVFDIDSVTAEEADVVVVAVRAADASTPDLLGSLCGRPGARFVVIVEQHWSLDLPTAIAHGVRAVLWRTGLSTAVFIRTLITVAEGGASYPSSLQGSLVAYVQQTYQRAPARPGLSASDMTARELDVLRLISEGLEITEIAMKLSYSERTVKNILYGLMKRRQFRNRTHAVSQTVRAGHI